MIAASVLKLPLCGAGGGRTDDCNANCYTSNETKLSGILSLEYKIHKTKQSYKRGKPHSIIKCNKVHCNKQYRALVIL